jgi:glycosyltransferase involved in cell wall biosynthesis
LTSIILPTFNSISFLKERVQSILSQTYSAWECIIIDGFSSDGTWEYLQKIAQSDNRFSLFQYPPNGPYNAWNNGIEKAKGEYIYIATSDDTMEPDFLKKMVHAIDENPDCDIAHCCLGIIDEAGEPHSSQWKDWPKVRFYGDLIKINHKRIAPHDAVVHMGWSTVYTSINQLLIRKSLFDRIGVFSTNFGSIADFEWGFRASMAANIIHVPELLAYWRKHQRQLTQDDYFQSHNFYKQLIKMMLHVLKKHPEVKFLFPSSSWKEDLLSVYQYQWAQKKYYILGSKIKKGAFLSLLALTQPRTLFELIANRLKPLSSQEIEGKVRAVLQKNQLFNHIEKA